MADKMPPELLERFKEKAAKNEKIDRAKAKAKKHKENKQHSK